MRKNRNEGVAAVVAYKSFVRVQFRVKENYFTKNHRVQSKRLKTAKSKTVDLCRLGKANIKNVSLTSEIAPNYKRSNLKVLTKIEIKIVDKSLDYAPI